MNPTRTRPTSLPRPLSALMTALLLAGTAVSTWWVTRTPPHEEAAAGGFSLDEADHAIDPLVLPAWAETLIGVSALVITLAMAALLVRAMVVERLDRRWGAVILSLTPIAAMAGLWWMIGTAPVIGANIGFGLASMVFGPASLILLAVAIALSIPILRSR